MHGEKPEAESAAELEAELGRSTQTQLTVRNPLGVEVRYDRLTAGTIDHYRFMMSLTLL